MGVVCLQSQIYQRRQPEEERTVIAEALPLRDLWRTGRHAEFGRITILRQVNYMACHEQTHLPDIEQLRQRFVPSPVS
jgi:hypothetical protein